MKTLTAVLFLLVAAFGCNKSAKIEVHGDALKIDDRYAQVIEFTALDLRVPLGRNAYVRVDAPVADTHEHLHAVLHELGVSPKKIFLTNPVKGGMQVHLGFRDEKQCSFIWAKQDSDARLTRASIEHEKYHAVCRLKPEAIEAISSSISELGFNIDRAAHDEELAATVIQMLTLHREGIPLQELHGSEMVAKAVDLPKANQIWPNKRVPTTD